MELLRVELAIFTGLDELDGVLNCNGPVETTAECLASEGARRGVVAEVSQVDVSEQISPLLDGDALQRDPIGEPTVQVAFPKLVEGSPESYALTSCIIL